MNTTDLLAIARAATPGEWEDIPWSNGASEVVNLGGGVVAACHDHENARHIATFSPARVIALLERLERLEHAVNKARAYIYELENGVAFGDDVDHAENWNTARRALEEA